MGNSGSKTQFKHKGIPKRAIIKQSVKAVGIDYIVYLVLDSHYLPHSPEIINTSELCHWAEEATEIYRNLYAAWS